MISKCNIFKADSFGLVASAAPITKSCRRKKPEQPNVILIITDDQGYGDFGVKANPILKTPNLDQLAGESVERNNDDINPVCAPTRACLMTGRYGSRTSVIDTFLGRARMEPEAATLAELLHDKGYATGIFGKGRKETAAGRCDSNRAMKTNLPRTGLYYT